MATTLLSIDTQHDDMIHDSQFDYYAKRLATCSSDRSIKIFDTTGDRFRNSATLTGHEGPVWQVAWAHPKFGTLLASCSYDGRYDKIIDWPVTSEESLILPTSSSLCPFSVMIHRETTPNTWTVVHTHKFHEASVNSISWAPHDYGLILACASSDGRISVLEYMGDNW